ncbi:EpsG family protein [Shewanella xiamenensis]|uniref:EpsG family protein n=1 Tax=Shewanella xiamenensis TaxID=332186 RepID=UPI0021C21B4B|nr:EpsG family protein [Shewanella xiamenensis]MCT8864531.1 EpsG family protein [Shewanella xiamenensis]
MSLALFYSLFAFWVNLKQRPFIANSVLFHLPILYLLIVISSLRWETGTDWYMYHLFYESADRLADFFSNVYFEKGYSLINYVSKVFGSYSYVLFFQIITIVFFWVCAIKVSGVNLNLALFVLFFSKIFILFPVRQDIAVSIVWFFLICYISTGNKLLPLIGCVGALFHSSAYVSALLYFSKFRFKGLTVYISCFVFFLLGTQKDLLLSGLGYLSGLQQTNFARLLDYISGDVIVVVDGVDYYVRNLIRIAESLFFLSIFLYFRERINTFFYNSLFTVYFFGVCLMLFSIFNFRIFLRFSPYFSLAEVFMWPILFSFIRCNYRTRFYMIFLCLFILVYNVKLLMVLKGFWDEYNPYQQILF